MGIRIHRMIGFGLTDVAIAGGEITDYRINPDSPLLEVWHQDDAAEYAAFARARIARLGLEGGVEESLLEMRLDSAGQDASAACVEVHHDEHDEGEPPGFLIMRPVGDRDWYRSDDTIDHYDAATRGETMQTSVRVLEGGIFPYDGRWMDSATGHVFMRDRDFDLLRDVIRMGPKYWRGEGDDLARKCGFEDMADATERIKPAIPDPIVELVEYGQLFTSPETMWQLRPMVATWWS